METEPSHWNLHVAGYDGRSSSFFDSGGGPDLSSFFIAHTKPSEPFFNATIKKQQVLGVWADTAGRPESGAPCPSAYMVWKNFTMPIEGGRLPRLLEPWIRHWPVTHLLASDRVADQASRWIIITNFQNSYWVAVK